MNLNLNLKLSFNLELEAKLQAILEDYFNKKINACTDKELLYGLIKLVKAYPENKNNKNKINKKLYYISAEFLIGKLLSNNLINLGLYDDVKIILEQNGKSLAKLEETEPEPSLGNGGLGRLAACFLDSIATLGLPGDGIGLNYHMGLFKQTFEDNKQKELPNPWLQTHSWLTKTDTSFKIQFGGFSLKSTMYDIGITGYKKENIANKLHLFDVDSIDEAIIKKDSISFDKEDIKHNLTLFLYPDDSDENGKLLRIYQQYFMVSNAAQLILKEMKEKKYSLNDLDKHAVIQINDTHPTMVIPELIRLLCDEGINMDEAIKIVSNTCAYTNHTIQAEALEKWPLEYLEKVVPQLIPIIKELDRRVRLICSDEKMQIITNNNTNKINNNTKNNKIIHMAHIDIHYGFSVNGVAALHTEILKNTQLKSFYELYPQKFNNKTNGITFRRWLLHCNPELANFISELIGDTFWEEAGNLEKLLAFKNDKTVLDKLLAIKQKNKQALAMYLNQSQNLKVPINENSIFDIQVKRLHEYKRQQMNALYCIYKYLEIKAGKLPPRQITIIFGAKAAPSYVSAKDIIHLILCLQELINSDADVSPWLRILMVENYNVTKAEKLIPACDISEQISLASQEASGTGNMKFMLNGAVTIGTMDGANVEINNLVGENNIYIFGKSSEEVLDTYAKKSYNALKLYDSDLGIQKLLDFIISKQMMRLGDPENLGRLYKDLTRKDWFMALPDLSEYISIKERALSDYENRYEWAQKMLINIAKAGYFSSDRTISEYNRDIWHLV